MIKKILAFIFICSIPALWAENNTVWLELKPGYFFFTNSKLRNIYKGGFEIQGSGSYLFCRNMALYGSLGYLQAKGKSLHAKQKTLISQVPLDVGLRAIADFGECLKGYLTIGPRYFYFNQRNNSSYVNRNIRRSGIGFFANGGFNFIYDCYLLGFFGEYAFGKKSFKSHIPNVYGRQNIQIGVFTAGGSVGLAF